MGEIVNLRRARKGKARNEAAARADANRVKHGVSKSFRDFAKADDEKQKQAIDAHRLKDRET